MAKHFCKLIFDEKKWLNIFAKQNFGIRRTARRFRTSRWAPDRQNKKTHERASLVNIHIYAVCEGMQEKINNKQLYTKYSYT